MPPERITDRDVLAGDAYASATHLAARQDLYSWQQPRYDLPAIVLDQITGATGVVVDVGCGNGRYLRRLRDARNDLIVVGLDISTGILRDLEPPVLVADAQFLPLQTSAASVVLTMHMLYHLADIDAGLIEVQRILRADGVLIASTNARDDKTELDQLWSAAAADVLGVAEGPHRISLSARFSLDDAPAILGRHFAHVDLIELPGTITVTIPEPVLAHLGSYRSWVADTEVPFDETLQRTHERLTDHIQTHGAFHINCRSGILICRSLAARHQPQSIID